MLTVVGCCGCEGGEGEGEGEEGWELHFDGGGVMCEAGGVCLLVVGEWNELDVEKWELRDKDKLFDGDSKGRELEEFIYRLDCGYL